MGGQSVSQEVIIIMCHCQHVKIALKGQGKILNITLNLIGLKGQY